MPDWREKIARRLSSLNLDSTRESDIIEELAQHLEDRYLELVSGGATDDDARRDVPARRAARVDPVALHTNNDRRGNADRSESSSRLDPPGRKLRAVFT
jgi:hypothetical protein